MRLPTLREALADVVRALVVRHEDVVVTEVSASERTFAVTVNPGDYDIVISSVPLISRLALGLARLPDWKEMRIDVSHSNGEAHGGTAH
jgi:hypothetical protein